MRCEYKLSAVEYSAQMAEKINSVTLPDEKKAKGQFFTSEGISRFMAELSKMGRKKMKVLDAGAGAGILTSAIVDRIIAENLDVYLYIDLVEKDSVVLPYLKLVMEHCKALMYDAGKKFEYQIKEVDFILDNSNLFETTLFNLEKVDDLREELKYDLIISNPPYFKVQKKHEYSEILNEYVHGQPNIYFMFMAVASKLLKKEGQLVFITPRSFCSGAYFEKFREKFFEEIDTEQIHLFVSRKGNFKGESVLQENIILSGYRRSVTYSIVISSSTTSDIKCDYSEIQFSKSLIFDSSSQKQLVRLPINEFEAKILKSFDKWSNNLIQMNMNISTGPVITFRNREEISEYDVDKTYPLLFMKHLSNLMVNFPLDSKEEGVSKETEKNMLLIPSKNYVLLKRFTSKEQKKRIDGAAYYKKNYQHDFIGLENHLNYIYRPGGELTAEEMYGVLGFLNSTAVDRYFRIINGNTQVNASDIRPLPFPDYEDIVRLGSKIIENNLDFSLIEEYMQINQT